MRILFTILIVLIQYNCKKTTKSEPDLLVLSMVPSHASIFGGSDGSIDLTVAGGDSPFQYQWSNGVNTEDISNLTAGIYSVVVTDARDQVETDSTIIIEPPYQEKYFGQISPGTTPKIFAPGVISKNLYEYKLLIRPYSNEVFYEIWNSTLQKSQSYVLEWSNESWTNPEIFIPYGSFNNELGCFSSDGAIIYLSSNEPLGGYSYDIKYMTWLSGQWSNQNSVGSPVNTDKREQSPSICTTGNLYYYSELENSTGIYRANNVNGVFEQPSALSNAINSLESHNPCIASDESFIIFTSYRSGGYGDADLYISFNNTNGLWMDAINMGPSINSAGQDDYASISPDGKFLFFASSRNSNDGTTDIYWVETVVIDGLK